MMRDRTDRFGVYALGPVVLGLAAAAVAFPSAVLGGYLVAFGLASSLAVGGLLLALLARIIPGPWQQTIAPSATLLGSSGVWLIPLVLPVLLGGGWIFPWMNDTGLVGFRAVYLSPVFFGARVVGFLLFVAVLARLLPAWGRPFAIAGLIALVVYDGLFAVDAFMSLDPEFHSSGFALYILGIQALTAFAALIVIRLHRSTSIQEAKSLVATRILGRLFLCLTLLWSYFFFMQYFILWSGNLPSGAAWFARRGEGMWRAAALFVAVTRLVPTALLLFGPIRRSRRWLMSFALATMAGSAVEFAWLVLPEFGGNVAVALISAAASWFVLFVTMRALGRSRSKSLPSNRISGEAG